MKGDSTARRWNKGKQAEKSKADEPRGLGK